MKSVLLSFLLVSVCSFTVSAKEGTEWMTAYWYNATDSQLPRVLLIGDSIVKGYEETVRDQLAGIAYVSFYATSKSVSDPSYLKEMAYILDQYHYDVVQINNGLHSLNDDPRKWRTSLIQALQMIRERAPKAKIIWASSTPLKDPALTAKVQILNDLAFPVMVQQKIPILDLFSIMNPMDRSVYWVDTYHFSKAAVQIQGDNVSQIIRQQLGAGPVAPAVAKKALASAQSDTGPDGRIVTLPVPLTGIIRNGGFETDEGWSLYPPNGKGTFTIDKEIVHSGSCSAKITVTEGGTQLYQSGPPFEKSASYTVRFWAKALSPGNLDFYVRTVQPPYQFMGRQNPVSVDENWKEYDTTMSFPSDYDASKYRLFFEFPSPGVYWIDGVNVEKN